MRNLFQSVTRLFGGKPAKQPGPAAGNAGQHSVIVHLYGNPIIFQEMTVLEDRMIEAIDAAGVGEFDGNEFAVNGSHAMLFMYGPDADRLLEAVLPVLKSSKYSKGMKAQLRYGPPDREVPTRTVLIEE